MIAVFLGIGWWWFPEVRVRLTEEMCSDCGRSSSSGGVRYREKSQEADTCLCELGRADWRAATRMTTTRAGRAGRLARARLRLRFCSLLWPRDKGAGSVALALVPAATGPLTDDGRQAMSAVRIMGLACACVRVCVCARVSDALAGSMAGKRLGPGTPHYTAPRPRAHRALQPSAPSRCPATFSPARACPLQSFVRPDGRDDDEGQAAGQPAPARATHSRPPFGPSLENRHSIESLADGPMGVRRRRTTQQHRRNEKTQLRRRRPIAARRRARGRRQEQLHLASLVVSSNCVDRATTRRTRARSSQAPPACPT